VRQSWVAQGPLLAQGEAVAQQNKYLWLALSDEYDPQQIVMDQHIFSFPEFTNHFSRTSNPPLIHKSIIYSNLLEKINM
jgi:hypothetical protein